MIAFDEPQLSVDRSPTPVTPRTVAGARDHLRRALVRIATAGAAFDAAPGAEDQPALDDLRRAVAAYAAALQAVGEPPQRMLVRLKALLRETTPPLYDGVRQRRLAETVVRWGIDAYYAG